MNLVIDSSVFVSALRPREVHSHISRNFFKKITELRTTGILTWMTVLEAANVFAREGNFAKRFGRTEHFFERFKAHQLIAIDRPFATKVIPLFGMFDLKAADAIVVASAAFNQAVLVSWDLKLVEQARRLVPAYTPDEFFLKI